jgi:rod shape-determining protein MreC
VARARRQRWSRRPRLVLALLVLVSITLITLDTRGGGHTEINRVKTWASDAFDPLRQGVDDLTEPVAGFLAGAIDAPSVQRANAQLRQQVGNLQEQLEQQADLQRQISVLDKLDKLQFADEIPKIVAEVNDLGTSEFAETIDIDKGTSSGVDIGMPVVGGEGLIGIVSESSSDEATVQLLTDPGSSISVRYGTAGNTAVVGGQGAGSPLTVDYIVPRTPVSAGEILYTSGLAHGLYPEGIPVARLNASSSQSAGATQENVTATPVASLTNLQYVAVLEWEPQP